MKKFNVTINCKAVYTSQIEVPDNATFEEAIEFAKKNIRDISLGELEYIPDSDIIDEENCDFEENDFINEDYQEITENQENIIKLWDKFDEKMEENGYTVTVITEDVRDEEREFFGKPLSSLSSLAYKDDNYCAKIKLIIHNDVEGFDIVVYEGDGTNMVTTKEIGRMNFLEYTEESLKKGIDKIINIFGNFNKDNPIPQTWKKLIL